jgi:hypothetical protein
MAQYDSQVKHHNKNNNIFSLFLFLIFSPENINKNLKIEAETLKQAFNNREFEREVKF